MYYELNVIFIYKNQLSSNVIMKSHSGLRNMYLEGNEHDLIQFQVVISDDVKSLTNSDKSRSSI